jgi:hypothetical protein
VEGHVGSCGTEQVRVIPEQTEPVVAALAQQLAHAPGAVVVIEVLR